LLTCTCKQIYIYIYIPFSLGDYIIHKYLGGKNSKGTTVPPSNFVTGGWSKKWQLYPSPVIFLKDWDFDGSRGPKSKQSMVFSSHLWRVLAVKVLFDENLSSGINSFQWGISQQENCHGWRWTACFFIYIYKKNTWKHDIYSTLIVSKKSSLRSMHCSLNMKMSSWYI
jgi:hypothetical protein